MRQNLLEAPRSGFGFVSIAHDGKNGAENLLKDGYDAVFLAPGLWEAASIRTEDKDIDGLFSSIGGYACLYKLDGILSFCCGITGSRSRSTG